MQTPFLPTLCAALFGLAVVFNGCGGRSINDNAARDAITSSPADFLTKEDIDVSSILQLSAGEAVVETELHSAFRLERVDGRWVAREIRIGSGQWEKLDDLLAALKQVKIAGTRNMLERIAEAIEAYREKNGHLPEFSGYVDLSDVLNPDYLSPLIREDAWRTPLSGYRLSSGAIRIVSAGPDTREGTGDDIELIIAGRS